MSALRISNYRTPSVANATVRALVMARDLETFCSDIGREPYTPEEARAIMADGGITVPGRYWEGETPAVGTDCFKALDEGAKNWDSLQTSWDLDTYFNDEPLDSMTSATWAFWEVEVDVSQQKADMWDRHECGGFTEEELPMFVRRATLEEDVMDMAFRQLVAERRQDDIRAGHAIGWCV
ncbi:MAG: hypothetical protein O9327_02315 [Polaromonas sp.]|nr:hypothetical protein [Polaromonas sp.]